MAVLIGVVAVVLAMNVWLVVWVNVSDWRRARRRRIGGHGPVLAPQGVLPSVDWSRGQGTVSGPPQGRRSPIRLS